jgi:hypothetical protein
LSNAWNGRDPLLRWLRVISILAFLAILVVVVLDPARAADTPLVALLSGAVLLQLGFEVVVPGFAKGARSADQEDEADERRS